MHDVSRRDCLRLGLGAALAGTVAPSAWAQHVEKPAARAARKSVAAVVTNYHFNSHADVILGKILEGWQQDGGPGPALQLASIYIDQTPATDIGRAACRKHGVEIFDSIEEAVTLGGDRVPVDAVLSIGEHGDYPFNDIGQHLYPHRPADVSGRANAAYQRYSRSGDGLAVARGQASGITRACNLVPAGRLSACTARGFI